MPLVPFDTHRCYYRDQGPDDRPVVILSHSLGCDHGMWDAQASDLAAHFRVVRYDTRGHGGSSAPAGNYTIAELGHDVLVLTDRLGIRQFAFCGLSLGGMIGQWLAVNAPERLTHLVLANTTARLSDPGALEGRRKTVLESGLAAVADTVMARFFSAEVLAAKPPIVAATRRALLATDSVGYAGCCAAIRDMDQRPLLSRISVPTLVISGEYDVAMPWDHHGAQLLAQIPGARAVRLPAAHLSNLERPRSFNAALFEFLLPAPGDRRASGLAMRRASLGHDYVERALASASEFTREFQQLVTELPWGTIWTRPGLDSRTRRLLVLTTTAALGRWEEFRLHVRTGLTHELEPSDLKEVLLQIAVYAGIPAANAAFHIAEEELKKS